jgi:hypothetical protein
VGYTEPGMTVTFKEDLDEFAEADQEGDWELIDGEWEWVEAEEEESDYDQDLADNFADYDWDEVWEEYEDYDVFEWFAELS